MAMIERLHKSSSFLSVPDGRKHFEMEINWSSSAIKLHLSEDYCASLFDLDSEKLLIELEYVKKIDSKG